MIYLLDTNILIYLIKNLPHRVAEPVFYPDGLAICSHYAVQATALKRQATPIDGNVLWIAAHAVALGATLVLGVGGL